MARRRALILSDGSAAEQRIRRALQQRPRGGSRRRADFPKNDYARRFWSERAWSELCAVPGMAQTTLALVRQQGGLAALSALTLIQSDEVEHTELSRDVADALGGYVEDLPLTAPYDPERLAHQGPTPLAFWIIGNGCISETVSLELLRARLTHATHPLIRAVLTRVLKDEAVHARMSWVLAERVLPTLPEGQRRVLADYARAGIDVMGRSFATFALPANQRREARKLRAKCVGLGAAPPDVEDAVCVETVRKTIVPRLARLGLQI